MLLAAWTLWTREIVRFYRQPSRIVGALGSPVLFWVLIGSGLGRSFKAEGSLAGRVSGIFLPRHARADRPVHGDLLDDLGDRRSAGRISAGRARGAGTARGDRAGQDPRQRHAGGDAGCVLPAAGAAHVRVSLDVTTIVRAARDPAVLAFGLSGLGFSSPGGSTRPQGFHAIMNLFLVPMWLLSGALFPVKRRNRRGFSG